MLPFNLNLIRQYLVLSVLAVSGLGFRNNENQGSELVNVGIPAGINEHWSSQQIIKTSS